MAIFQISHSGICFTKIKCQSVALGANSTISSVLRCFLDELFHISTIFVLKSVSVLCFSSLHSFFCAVFMENMGKTLLSGGEKGLHNSRLHITSVTVDGINYLIWRGLLIWPLQYKACLDLL